MYKEAGKYVQKEDIMPILAAFMVPHPPMIVPQIGRGSEEQVKETIRSYQQIAGEIADLKPDTIVITSPHTVLYQDYFHISPGKEADGSFAAFQAPEVQFHEYYDEKLRDEICRLAPEQGIAAGTLGERDARLDHGTMVPLWFIRQRYTEGKILRIGLSGLPLADHYALGEVIRDAADRTGKRVVFVASGDLSHKLQSYGPYGFAPQGPEYDQRIMDVCGRAAFDELFDFDEAFCEKAAECGHRSFVIMAGALDGMDVEAETLSHEDVTGVGYGICTFYPKQENAKRCFLKKYTETVLQEIARQREQADDYVKLARQSLESYIQQGQWLQIPEDLPPEMLTEQAGAFVSIHKQGRLRGCIGTILPTASCVAEEIIHNAVSASVKDPRFDPITEEELPWLEINVDVLGEPEEIDSPMDLDVKRYGVIVTSGHKRGLLLPDLEGVDTVEQQIAIAMRKAGIKPGEKMSLQRFEVIRHV